MKYLVGYSKDNITAVEEEDGKLFLRGNPGQWIDGSLVAPPTFTSINVEGLNCIVFMDTVLDKFGFEVWRSLVETTQMDIGMALATGAVPYREYPWPHKDAPWLFKRMIAIHQKRTRSSQPWPGGIAPDEQKIFSQ